MASRTKRGGDAPSWRRATLISCKHCGQPVLHGYDRDVAALLVNVEVTPVSQDTERVLHLHSVATYALGKGGVLWNRWPGTTKPPFNSSIHAEHRCPARNASTLSARPGADTPGANHASDTTEATSRPDGTAG